MADQLIIHKHFTQVASRYSDRVCFQIKKDAVWEKWTYAQINNLSLQIGAFIIQEGFKKGDFAAICLENRPEWSAIYLGIMAAGLTSVPLDPQLTVSEIENLITDCSAKIIFVSHAVFKTNHLDKIKDKLNKIVILDLDIDTKNTSGLTQVRRTSPEGIFWPEVDSEDVASLIYTSGTTGKPKGVMLTHKNVCVNAESINQLKLFSDKDTFLSILPLHHAFPFTVTLLMPLFYRIRVVYASSLRIDEWLDLMRQTGVTVLPGVPQLFSLFYKNLSEKLNKKSFFVRMSFLGLKEILWQIRRMSGFNLSKRILSKIHRPFGPSLRFFLCGGAKLNEEAARFLEHIGFTILEGYGLTETSPGVALNPLKRPRIGSAGKAIPDVELKIDSPDATGRGEVLIKGPNIMKGYFKRPEETASVVRDGWFYSGDLGCLDQDGYLYITGRKKEIIVLSSGKKIYPEEIESHYGKSPYIKEIGVLGVGQVQEDRLIAVVVPDANYCRTVGEVNINSRIKFELEVHSESLAAYKRIKGYVIARQDLPRTRLGKIKRHEVKMSYMDELKGLKPKDPPEEIPATDEELRLVASDVGKKIMIILDKQAKLQKRISHSDHLELDLGIDSLGRVELAVVIEQALGRDLPNGLMTKVSTVRELMLEIEKLESGEPAGVESASPVKSEILWNEILNANPSEAIIKKVNLKPNGLADFGMWLFSAIVLLLFRLVWRLKVNGAEHIPRAGKCILCVNHGSYLDGFIVMASIPANLRKNLFLVGFRAYFEVSLIKNIVKLIRVIPIDPSRHLMETMQACAYTLKNDKLICIFPEGDRTVDGEVKEFKKGAGILSKELNVPLVPVWITGSYESWPRTKRFPKPHPITITFGRPYDFEELKIEGSRCGAKDDYEAIVSGLRQEVIKLKSL